MIVFGPLSAALVGLMAAPEAGASLEVSSSADTTPWIRRHRPRRNMFHLGVFGGVFLPARDIELFEVDGTAADQGFRPYSLVAPEFGGRFGFFPLDFLGLEIEGAYGLGSVEGGERANLWAARGHVLGQVPRWSVTPFVLAGAGVLGVSSGDAAVGNDADLAFHLGGGLMVHVTRGFTLRVDVRNTISPQQGPNGGATNNPEILFGVGWTRRPAREPEPERPVAVAEPEPAAADTDGDGFVDDEDACPDEVGVAPNGCPDPDPDNDGVFGNEDACPDEAGTMPDGCPVADADGDGIADAVDLCIDEPETINEFQDDDGCPDQVPEELGSFEGTLEGVTFQIDSATLRPGSRKKLNAVAAVLKKYPEARVEISGHTDSTGSVEHNVELSQARADAVKAYLVQHGVAPDRVDTRGAGPDEPIDTNASSEGRARNRRIEFRLLNCKCGG